MSMPLQLASDVIALSNDTVAQAGWPALIWAKCLSGNPPNFVFLLCACSSVDEFFELYRGAESADCKMLHNLAYRICT